jgi:hypothetical protein
MTNEAAKALLLRLDHDLKHPRGTTQAVMTSAHGDLVSALEAALAREDALLKAAPKAPAPQQPEPAKRQAPLLRDGHKTI